MVDSADEITDYTLATGSQPANWNTCWKVDSGGTKGLFRECYESVRNEEKNVSAILDFPSSTTGKIAPQNPIIRDTYIDLPGDAVDMKDWLSKQSGDGIARAYFSDYLMKTGADNQYHILARFDFYLAWNPAKTAAKKDFSIHSVKSIATTSLLECHKAALLHETTKNKQPFKDFYDRIHQ